MPLLKEKLAKKIPEWRKEIIDLLKNHSNTVVSTVTVAQLLKGMREVNAVLCDTSVVDPHEGLFIRGIPVLDLIDRSVEEIFFLLCTGEFPDQPAIADLQADLASRRSTPEYIWAMIDSLPEDAHPMTLLSMSMLAMQRESVFYIRYNQGISRKQYWEPTLEDALNIMARLPVIAAGIYRKRILRQEIIPPNPKAGFSENFAQMLGIDDPEGEFQKFIKMFMVVHSDHEGANASVLTSRIVNSSLSDLYYSISASMNSLAGPLHGLANQESVKFALNILTKFAGIPSEDQLREYLWSFLNSGKVIPGFGHAVLRASDPRYVALYDYGKKICQDNAVFQIVDKMGKVAPQLLKKQGKAKNPYPNIDGISGALLYHFGMTDLKYYTVMFSTSQILGICAQIIINQAIGVNIFRPRSISTRRLKNCVEETH